MMNFRVQLNAHTSGKQTAGERTSIIRSARGMRRVWAKENEMLGKHFLKKFYPRRSDAHTEAERAEVINAYEKLDRKWGF